MATLVRARVLHVPRDPFAEPGALESFESGALAFEDGRILAVGDSAELARAYPEAERLDAPGAFLLPGMVDAHVHWPQLGILGSMGLELLDWLERVALPEEARLADAEHARTLAREFLRGLAGTGTTTALVFGTHFPEAQDLFFAEAERSGLRIASGLVVSDRGLRPDLLRSPADALATGRDLAARWHGRGRLRYAITPRFALSCTDEMLAGAGELAAELPGALVTTHVNESPAEVRAVAELFPRAGDYLATYERHGLVGPRTVLAHDVHVTDSELRRLAAARAAVACCASSNARLGSGIFPMRRHLEHGVRFALGTDVGAGAGLGLLREGLTAYEVQRLAGLSLTPERLLWLATRAGADALGLGDELGDLSPGRAADFVLLEPPAGSLLEATLRRADSAEAALGALFTLAGEESVVHVRVAGEQVA